jgi:hypothetical protein
VVISQASCQRRELLSRHAPTYEMQIPASFVTSSLITQCKQIATLMLVPVLIVQKFPHHPPSRETVAVGFRCGIPIRGGIATARDATEDCVGYVGEPRHPGTCLSAGRCDL